MKDENGKITGKGIYTTDDSGYVVRYDLFDTVGKLISTTVPYYSRDGRLLESREYGPTGQLVEVAVIIGDRIVGLDPNGEKLTKYDNTRVDTEGFRKHFQKKK